MFTIATPQGASGYFIFLTLALALVVFGFVVLATTFLSLVAGLLNFASLDLSLATLFLCNSPFFRALSMEDMAAFVDSGVGFLIAPFTVAFKFFLNAWLRT